jgi:hypothetical protein
MKGISSQDFRNIYEKFYNLMRNYLWPYQTLKELANLETDIYAAFIDFNQLEADFSKLRSSIKDACKDDDKLAECANKIQSMLGTKGECYFARLPRVAEANPQTSKQLKTLDTKED